VIPISLLLREELMGLLPPERQAPQAKLRGGAQAVLEALTARGALFFADLKAATGLLPTQLEDALRELAAVGLVTSDSFAAVRKIVEGNKSPRASRSKARRRLHGASAPIGRWSLFPVATVAESREAYLDHWCWQLLKRWGVVFRDLVVRESSAPSW